jgi:hypothetical protein
MLLVLKPAETAMASAAAFRAALIRIVTGAPAAVKRLIA